MILCQCKGVTDRTIETLISEGANSLKAIANSCGAGRKCKPCAAEIISMLDRVNAASDQEMRCAA
jgi:bacterioferritin-associated ferredoxin